jgi:uncharacterized protein (DUF305 family)
MNKQIPIGILAVVLGILSIGAGKLILDKVESSNQNASMTESKDDGMLKDTLSTLEGDKFDEAFINDMVEHHAGAVAMAELIDTEARDPRIQQLAAAIKTTQTKEINDMKTWAKDWGYAFKEPRQSAIDEMVSGMVDKAGAELDIAFLSHMIGHHQSALDMSTLANSNAKHQELKTLSRQIYIAQQAEIKLMKDIASDAGYTLTITDGHQHDGQIDNHDTVHSDTTVKH